MRRCLVSIFLLVTKNTKGIRTTKLRDQDQKFPENTKIVFFMFSKTVFNNMNQTYHTFEFYSFKIEINSFR